MKYKIGDRVRIKSIDWYNKNKDKNGYVDVGVLFDKEMSRWCGKTMTIIKVNQLYYTMEEDGISQFFWTDGTIECKIEEDERTEKLRQDALKYESTTMGKAFDWFCKHGLEYIKAEPIGSCAVGHTVNFADMWEAYKKAMEE